MAKTKKTPEKHSLLEIAGEKAEAFKEGFIAGKDKIVSAVEEKLESAKKAIHEFTAPSAKPKATKKTVKKAVKKVVKKAAKKAPVKAVKKVVKKAGKKK